MSSNSGARGSISGGRSRALKHSAEKGTPQLSCESCQERKVRCDKLNPCTNCRKIGVTCIPVNRKRLPRGRHVQKDNDMRDRIRRLEALVSNLDSRGGPNTLDSVQAPRSDDTQARMEEFSPQSSEATQSRETKSPATSTRATIRVKEESAEIPCVQHAVGSKYLIGKHFWEGLVQEVADLRQILEHESGDEEEPDLSLYDDEDSSKSKPESVPSHHSVCSSSILGTGSIYAAANRSLTSGTLSLRPTSKVYKDLCRIYVQQVDPLVKLLHRPSLEKFMLENEPYLNYEEGHTAVEALSGAVCYAAVASMTPEQCMAMFRTSRTSVAAEYRMACEAALERAGLVVTNDLTVVQAFCLYLIATRAVDHSRAVWVLMPVLVRLARSIALDRESHWKSNSFFNQQMRRRLWYTISWLDLHSSFSRGSEPLISPHEELPPLPKNLNDTDFGPDSGDDVPEVDGFSDMTFSIIVYNAQRVGKILNFSPTNEMKANSSESDFNWDAREKWVDNVEREIYRVARNVDPSSSSYAWFCRLGSRTLASAMKLSVLRPMHRSVLGGPPRIKGATQVLQLAAVVLESTYLTLNDPRGEPFRWYAMVQWHALATAITEAYECKDTDLLRRVWPLIEALFEHHREALAYHSDNKLWKPMEKMMRQTRAKVRNLLPQDQQISLAPPGKGILSSQPNGQDYQHLPVTGAYMDFSLPKHETSPRSASEVPSDYTSKSKNSSPPGFFMPFEFRMEGIDAQSCSSPPNNTNIASPMQPWYSPSTTMVPGQDPMNQVVQAQQAPASQLPQQISDPAWGTWENFVNGLAMDPMGGVNFSPSNLENPFPTEMNFNA